MSSPCRQARRRRRDGQRGAAEAPPGTAEEGRAASCRSRPHRPAYRPPTTFLSDPYRFAATFSLWLEAHGMEGARARDIAAIVFDPSAWIESIPRSKHDDRERKIWGKNPELLHNVMVRMEMRPGLDPALAAVSPALESASRQLRRTLKRRIGDAEATAWATFCATQIDILRSSQEVMRSAARLHLLRLGWPAATIERMQRAFSRL